MTTIKSERLKQMATTKVYRNTSDQTLNVLGVGEIPAGEQVSVTTEYQPPVVLENYPGLVEVTDEEVNETVAPDEAPAEEAPADEEGTVS